MTVETYDIQAQRPLAPSEGGRHWTGSLRRGLGGGAIGGLAGAIGGKHLGLNPLASGLAGAGLGVIHGGLKAHESHLGDKTTQERMAMREALREAKKQKKAEEGTDMIDPVTLRAMQEELAALTKDAGFGSFLGNVGGRLLGAAGKGAKAVGQAGSRLGASGGRLGQVGGRLSGAGQQFGALRGQAGRMVGGQENLKKMVGGAALGGAAIGATGFAAGRASKRPKPAGY